MNLNSFLSLESSTLLGGLLAHLRGAEAQPVRQEGDRVTSGKEAAEEPAGLRMSGLAFEAVLDRLTKALSPVAVQAPEENPEVLEPSLAQEGSVVSGDIEAGDEAAAGNGLEPGDGLNEDEIPRAEVPRESSATPEGRAKADLSVSAAVAVPLLGEAPDAAEQHPSKQEEPGPKVGEAGSHGGAARIPGGLRTPGSVRTTEGTALEISARAPLDRIVNTEVGALRAEEKSALDGSRRPSEGRETGTLGPAPKDLGAVMPREAQATQAKGSQNPLGLEKGSPEGTKLHAQAEELPNEIAKFHAEAAKPQVRTLVSHGPQPANRQPSPVQTDHSGAPEKALPALPDPAGNQGQGRTSASSLSKQATVSLEHVVSLPIKADRPSGSPKPSEIAQPQGSSQDGPTRQEIPGAKIHLPAEVEFVQGSKNQKVFVPSSTDLAQADPKSVDASSERRSETGKIQETITHDPEISNAGAKSVSNKVGDRRLAKEGPPGVGAQSQQVTGTRSQAESVPRAAQDGSLGIQAREDLLPVSNRHPVLTATKHEQNPDARGFSEGPDSSRPRPGQKLPVFEPLAQNESHVHAARPKETGSQAMDRSQVHESRPLGAGHLEAGLGHVENEPSGRTEKSGSLNRVLKPEKPQVPSELRANTAPLDFEFSPETSRPKIDSNPQGRASQELEASSASPRPAERIPTILESSVTARPDTARVREPGPHNEPGPGNEVKARTSAGSRLEKAVPVADQEHEETRQGKGRGIQQAAGQAKAIAERLGAKNQGPEGNPAPISFRVKASQEARVNNHPVSVEQEANLSGLTDKAEEIPVKARDSSRSAVLETAGLPAKAVGTTRPQSSPVGPQLDERAAGQIPVAAVTSQIPMPVVLGNTQVSSMGRNPVEVAVLGDLVVKQVTRAMVEGVRKDVTEIRLTLHPEALGYLHIILRVEKKGEVFAHMRASSRDASDALTKGIDQLKEALMEKGLELTQFQVSVGDFSLDSGSEPFSFETLDSRTHNGLELPLEEDSIPVMRIPAPTSLLDVLA